MSWTLSNLGNPKKSFSYATEPSSFLTTSPLTFKGLNIPDKSINVSSLANSFDENELPLASLNCFKASIEVVSSISL